MACVLRRSYKFYLLSPYIDFSLKYVPVRVKAVAVPIGIATVNNEVAKARSLSENHLFVTIICELRINGAAQAYMIVPKRTGQYQSVKIDNILNMAPKYCNVVAILNTLFVE